MMRLPLPPIKARLAAVRGDLSWYGRIFGRAEFNRHSREDVEQLVAEVQRLRAMLPPDGMQYVLMTDRILAHMGEHWSAPIRIKFLKRAGNRLEFMVTAALYSATPSVEEE